MYPDFGNPGFGFGMDDRFGGFGGFGDRRSPFTLANLGNGTTPPGWPGFSGGSFGFPRPEPVGGGGNPQPISAQPMPAQPAPVAPTPEPIGGGGNPQPVRFPVTVPFPQHPSGAPGMSGPISATLPTPAPMPTPQPVGGGGNPQAVSASFDPRVGRTLMPSLGMLR